MVQCCLSSSFMFSSRATWAGLIDPAEKHLPWPQGTYGGWAGSALFPGCWMDRAVLLMQCKCGADVRASCLSQGCCYKKMRWSHSLASSVAWEVSAVSWLSGPLCLYRNKTAQNLFVRWNHRLGFINATLDLRLGDVLSACLNSSQYLHSMGRQAGNQWLVCVSKTWVVYNKH